MVIPADLPALVAPVAWMLGTWEGWGMHANPAAPGQEASAEVPADSPVIEEIRAYASGAVVGAEAPRLAHGQVLVAHVEHGPDGPVVAALETHGVTTKNPATHARKASKKH